MFKLSETVTPKITIILVTLSSPGFPVGSEVGQA